MELRNSGRGLVQIKDDGTHAILPVTRRTEVQPDHARMPVMLLRHSDGKMRRDGSTAASMQPNTAVAERGRVHGAPGLAAVVAHRVQAWRRGPCRRKERKREWVKWYANDDRLRGQDKSRKVRTVGWVRNSAKFRLVRNIARVSRNLRFSATHYRRSTFDTLRSER
jgi:hypothetical protein